MTNKLTTTAHTEEDVFAALDLLIACEIEFARDGGSTGSYYNDTYVSDLCDRDELNAMIEAAGINWAYIERNYSNEHGYVSKDTGGSSAGSYAIRVSADLGGEEETTATPSAPLAHLDWQGFIAYAGATTIRRKWNERESCGFFTYTISDTDSGEILTDAYGESVYRVSEEKAAVVLMEREPTTSTTDAHTATVRCGSCGHYSTITLGLVSAILCPGCGVTIELGESGDTRTIEEGEEPRPTPEEINTETLGWLSDAYQMLSEEQRAEFCARHNKAREVLPSDAPETCGDCCREIPCYCHCHEESAHLTTAADLLAAVRDLRSADLIEMDDVRGLAPYRYEDLSTDDVGRIADEAAEAAAKRQEDERHLIDRITWSTLNPQIQRAMDAAGAAGDLLGVSTLLRACEWSYDEMGESRPAVYDAVEYVMSCEEARIVAIDAFDLEADPS